MRNNKEQVHNSFSIKDVAVSAAIALSIVLIGWLVALFVASNEDANKPMVGSDRDKALLQIQEYSDVVESSKPSLEKTEFITASLAALGDGEITKNEYTKIKELYRRVSSIDQLKSIKDNSSQQ